MEKTCANLIGEKHCMTPAIIYQAFKDAGIKMRPVMHKFMSKDTMMEANTALFALIINGDKKHMIDFISRR
jgi:hypothetical protein